LSIQQYTDEHLQAMVRWVISDDLPRTRQQIFEEVKSHLGFQRDGRIIVERITAAIGRVMGSPPGV
jgi:hypothetical protein